ncbi:predicted protein [Histoplasma capsulatum G186AR]|uniref:Uncharacterized protein n=1 Tax=Ajellomyces capsulatus (strain G186AR / H82 / ATCC MYA-2454 / RMSCC 2432) TaxID=447093 RepID=C0NXV8_AJECG|nr:uncharacterized protein HCBG_07752 [Histoplasma capsulatum G186AR]EEH03626.1 predicted protein [Histoplasma capsulatum G186AR]
MPSAINPLSRRRDNWRTGSAALDRMKAAFQQSLSKMSACTNGENRPRSSKFLVFRLRSSLKTYSADVPNATLSNAPRVAVRSHQAFAPFPSLLEVSMADITQLDTDRLPPDLQLPHQDSSGEQRRVSHDSSIAHLPFSLPKILI